MRRQLHRPDQLLDYIGSPIKILLIPFGFLLPIIRIKTSGAKSIFRAFLALVLSILILVGDNVELDESASFGLASF